jgi:hypothetical protein
MIDFLLLLILAGVTYCVASEGPWGAAYTFFAVLFGGLLAMNLFEPLAQSLQGSLGGGADVIALVGLFAVFVFGIRAATDYLMPTHVETQALVYDVGRWGLGLATGYVTMAVLLTALHTAPLPREFIGFRPERENLFEFAAPDRQWLAFTQYVSEHGLRSAGGAIFDGSVYPRIQEKRDQTMQVWSSFPIRYATRREEYMAGGGAGASGGGAPSSGGPPPTQRPTGQTKPQF